VASITVTNGKFAVYRGDNTDGSGTVVNIIAEETGAACVMKDATGKLWVFFTVAGTTNYDLKYYRSTDTAGDTWGSAVTVKTDIADCVPAAIQLPTGRIQVEYWGSDDKFYRSYSDDSGATWTEAEVTT
jgi:Neuraminidase (sialidase)